MRTKIIALVAMLTIAGMFAYGMNIADDFSLEWDNSGLVMGNPVARANAEEIESKIDIDKRNADIDASIRLAVLETEQKVRQEQLLLDSQARREMIGSFVQSLSWVLYILAVAVCVSLLIYAASIGYNNMQKAKYVTVQASKDTLQYPLLITADGYVYDPNTGSCAKLRNASEANGLLAGANERVKVAHQLAGAKADIEKTDRTIGALLQISQRAS